MPILSLQFAIHFILSDSVYIAVLTFYLAGFFANTVVTGFNFLADQTVHKHIALVINCVMQSHSYEGK